MSFASVQSLNLRKTASLFLLAIIFTNMVFMFVLLPIKEAHAIPVEVTTPSPLEAVWEALTQAWQTIQTGLGKLQSAFSGITAAFSIWEKAQKVAGDLINAALMVLLHRILQMITNEIIKWINGGGAPKFVSDWAGFLRDATNQAGGEFLNTLAGGFLCNPFAFQIRLALMPVPYNQQARCTLDKIKANFQAFSSNFSAGGGWPMWLQVIQPNNNFYGSYLMALDEKTRQEETARLKAQNEAMSGGGFLGDKKCMSCTISNTANGGGTMTFNDMKECESWKKTSGNGTSFKCNREQIMTPATIAQYEVQQAVDSTRKIIQDSIANLTGKTGLLTPYLVAIANALINRVIQTGLGYVAQAIAGGDQSYGPTLSNPNAPMVPTEPMVQQMVDTSGIISAGNSVASSPALITAENLLKENEQAKLTEQQKNLSVLISIQDKQAQTLTGLKDLVMQNCSLPSWATSQIISDNGTTQVIKLSATDTGSITIQKTNATSSIGTSSSVQVQEIIPAVAPQRTAMDLTIAATQQTLTDIDSSIAANRAAIASANDYQTAYDNAGFGALPEQQQRLTNAKKKMEDDYKNAVSTSQKAIGTNEESLTLILADAQQKSIAIIDETTQIESARGLLNSQLSIAQSRQTQTQTALTTCQNNNNGGGFSGQ